MRIRDLPAQLLALLSLVAGIGMSLKSGDWTWFARAGAAVVAIGIVLTSRQILEHNRRLLEYQRRQAQGPRSHLDWANENSIRQLIRARTSEEDHWRSEFSGFYMLVGGTLVWGFGDLVGRLAV
jgi:hypothetical protein